MELENFVNLVAEMRQTQCEYFATKSYIALKKSKRLEKRVDECVSIYRNEKLNGRSTQLELGLEF